MFFPDALFHETEAGPFTGAETSSITGYISSRKFWVVPPFPSGVNAFSGVQPYESSATLLQVLPVDTEAAARPGVLPGVHRPEHHERALAGRHRKE
jgi:hypothetical protein